MFESVVLYINTHSQTIPLGVFSLIAPLFEELLPPLPMLPVMVVLGVLARAQSYATVEIVPLLFLAALGRTVGAGIVYVIADKLEDVFVRYFGSYFGLTSESVNSIGKRLENHRSSVILFVLLRAVPLIPGTLLSFAAGVVRVSKAMFLFSTFIGTLTRDALLVYIGFVGIKFFANYLSDVEDTHLIIKLLFLVMITVTLLYLFVRQVRKKSKARSQYQGDS